MKKIYIIFVLVLGIIISGCSSTNKRGHGTSERYEAGERNLR